MLLTLKYSCREEEAAKEVLKEREMTYYENLGEIQNRDARNSSLKFMYAVPASAKGTSSSTYRVADGNDDPAVAMFWAKINEKKSKSMANKEEEEIAITSSSSSSFPEKGNGEKYDRHYKKNPLDNPLIKNAPREGTYVNGMSMALFKPFNEKLRNVQCSLCGEWGHRFGDRECTMREYNPHDFARLKREDPMTYFTEKLPEDKQLMVLSEAVSNKHIGVQSISAATTGDDDAYDSDPEAEFLATLTAREKSLLLRKLRILQGEEVPPISDTDSDSDSSSDDSDSSQSDHEHRKRSRKHKHSDKHKHKSKHKKHRKD